ncbi:unnamed protein product [Medioppia subpectinata]|uniref:ABC transporter domain-containing protein n=1 Tax=Medioppia subpectinata TaxID=1979941 RepID=A0A7R9KEI3_9ACAR|nr:unnamed protein product [Medioppia subpectinata]CAG2101120.1 unnamed protein product [Medioppia subpectinata]
MNGIILRKIFAMLGPNGTGKTTLMRVILGQLKLKSGTIEVFGKMAGSASLGIPGPGVGYMPQELALFDYFTIGEILYYYAMIYHMTREEIDESVNNLRELLHFPENSRIISQLSGGQQRRVSIAITMLHKPRLVILDEPTVGVDSLLRHRIWQYLENMCDKYGQTVIITTHYIEEARSAHNVAFIMSGAVLRQSNPQQLMDEYQCPTLEDVFLQLCHSKENTDNLNKDTKCSGNTNIYLDNNDIITPIEENINYKNNAFIDWQRMKAMLIKQTIMIKRRPLFVCAYYGLTIIGIIAMNMIITQDIKHIPFGVYNSDVINDNQTSLSRLFIDSLDLNNVRLSHYPSSDSAVKSVINGSNYLVFEFRDNFSNNFETRVTDMFDASNESIENGIIHLYVDFSNIHIGYMAVKYLLTGYNKFIDKLGLMLNKTRISEQLSTINIIEVFNGDLSKVGVTFMFLGPQMFIFMEFIWGMLLSAFIMVNDKSTNVMNRVFVSGVTEYEYMGAHILINGIISVGQVLLSMLFVFVVFAVQQSGMGIFTGLLLAIILADPISVVVATCSIMCMVLTISGVVWPIETIHPLYRFIAYSSPITIPIQSFRNIMVRGWTFTEPDVYHVPVVI